MWTYYDYRPLISPESSSSSQLMVNSEIFDTLTSSKAKCTANSWILEALEIWLLQEVKYHRVDDTLKVLLNLPTPISMFPCFNSRDVVQSEVLPSLKHAINSLKAYSMRYDTFGIEDAKIYDSLTYSDEVTAPDFAEHFINHSKSSHMLTALAVQVSNKILFSSDSLYDIKFGLPSELRDVAWLPADETRNDYAEMTGAYAMPGAYTELHQDCYVIPTYIIHVHGAKIWFLWPNNEKNRSHTVRLFLTGKGSIFGGDITGCLQNLSDLTCIYTRQPLTSFIFPSSMFHAVISLERSCHVVANICRLDLFEDSMDLLDKWTEIFLEKLDDLNVSIDEMKTLPDLTFDELRLTESPLEISDGLIDWARFLREKKEEKEKGNVIDKYCTRFESSLKNWIPVAECTHIMKKSGKRELDILRQVSEGKWDVVVNIGHQRR